MTPVVRNDWEVYVNGKEFTEEIFNSDDKKYWGTGDVFNPHVRTELVDEEQKMYKLNSELTSARWNRIEINISRRGAN